MQHWDTSFDKSKAVARYN